MIVNSSGSTPGRGAARAGVAALGRQVTVSKEGHAVDGRSIMGVMMLAAEQGSQIDVENQRTGGTRRARCHQRARGESLQRGGVR